MGLAAGLFFVLLALIVHGTVYAVGRLPFELRTPAGLNISRAPLKVGGIAQENVAGVARNPLDFWAALLIAVTGTLYRLSGRAPEPEAFPILSLFVGIAMSTIRQRMLGLDEGRALLRYRLLPIAGWKLLAITQDMIFLIPLAVMVSFLSLRTGVAFGLVAIAVKRYPSLRQRANQRRWRSLRRRRSTFRGSTGSNGWISWNGSGKDGTLGLGRCLRPLPGFRILGRVALETLLDCLVEKHALW